MSCLEIKRVEAGYGRIKVIQEVNIKVEQGKITLLVGPNGSGKTTLVRAILGLIPLLKGSIHLNGKRINGMITEKIVRMGVGLVPEGRHLFKEMSVKENLLMGGIVLNNQKRVEKEIEKVYQLFPILKERSNQLAGTLSGGEQQMLAIARALITGSRVLILDEPCNGIATGVVDKILQVIIYLKEKGCAILLVDQNTQTEEIADYVYALRSGKIVAEGRPEEVFPSIKSITKLFLS